MTFTFILKTFTSIIFILLSCTVIYRHKYQSNIYQIDFFKKMKISILKYDMASYGFRYL